MEDNDREDSSGNGQDPAERREASEKEVPKIEPDPGVTAPLDETTDEERREHGGPAGVMPGSGPDQPDEAEESPGDPEEASESP